MPTRSTARRARGPIWCGSMTFNQVHWSRPAIGLTRTDYFDYLGWLRDMLDLGKLNVCLVDIRSNDMQSIPAGEK